MKNFLPTYEIEQRGELKVFPQTQSFFISYNLLKIRRPEYYRRKSHQILRIF